MYKLISIDMDGTLLNSKGELSEENILAVKSAIKKGVKVVFTTGRGIRAITRFLDKVGLLESDEYVITNNGVSLYKSKTLKCLRANAISGQDLKTLCDVGINLGAKLHIYDFESEGCVVLEENEFTKFERDHIGMPTFVKPDYCDNFDDSKKAFKVLYLQNKDVIDYIEKNIPKYIFEKFNAVRSLDIALELFYKECNKGNAVKELADMFGFKREEIIAIGDQRNDLEMIEFAGLGVAMGNAIEKIKEVANYVTDTNDNNGVAKVINKFVLWKILSMDKNLSILFYCNLV